MDARHSLSWRDSVDVVGLISEWADTVAAKENLYTGFEMLFLDRVIIGWYLSECVAIVAEPLASAEEVSAVVSPSPASTLRETSVSSLVSNMGEDGVSCWTAGVISDSVLACCAVSENEVFWNWSGVSSKTGAVVTGERSERGGSNADGG